MKPRYIRNRRQARHRRRPPDQGGRNAVGIARAEPDQEQRRERQKKNQRQQQHEAVAAGRFGFLRHLRHEENC